MAVIEYEKRGHVSLVTLNRPAARNAIDPECIVRLMQVWREVSEDDGVRCVVITGQGDRAFCAGADLARLIPLLSGVREAENEWDRQVLADEGLSSQAMLRDFDPGKPILAAINGFAVAGGMELVQATDLRVAVSGARFGLQEVQRALFPSGGSTVRLPRQIPYVRAMELLLTGDLIDAGEALELGFINRVVEPDRLMETTFELAERIARNGPLAVRAIRAAVRAGLGVPDGEAMRRELDYSRPVMQSQDAREGSLAFLEKREPVFRGG
ncbi:enoyl-CoA hydratase-related protein [Myxococcota bacterium]|nr:enoyl-CoA hydratase-related protein [Myxococcota bacterium]